MSGLAGTGALVRLALRRDRVAIPAWLLGGAVLVLATAASFAGLDAPGERERLAASVAAEPALRGLYGQPYDLSTVGGATAWRMGHGGAAILAGLMSLLLVVRHTRADEESGRAELVGSTVVGRGADLASALAVAGLANAGLGASIALGLLGFGESVAGSVAFGLAVAGTGCLFAALAAACAQVAMVGLVALATAGFAVQVVLRLRAEETSGLAEPVLAGAVSRRAWSLSHLAVALAGAATLVLAAGTVMGLTDGARLGDVGGQAAELAGTALGQVPAVWTLAALAFALAGLLPRWSALVWAALGACVLVGQLGTSLGLPDWVADLSPFAHAPRRPFEGAGVGPLALTAVAAAALAALGLGGLRRRDLAS